MSQASTTDACVAQSPHEQVWGWLAVLVALSGLVIFSYGAVTAETVVLVIVGQMLFWVPMAAFLWWRAKWG